MFSLTPASSPAEIARPAGTLPGDAMTDRSAERHDHSVALIFPRIAETGSADDVLKLL